MDQVVDLWRRPPGKEMLSFDSSMLFSFFAQWFTDSFLRTDLSDRRKNTSNHEIDFCQLYGLNAEVTHALRAHAGGKLKCQEIGGEVYPPYLFDSDATTKNNWVFSDPAFETMHRRETLEFIFQSTPESRLKHMFATGLEQGNSNVGYTLLVTIFLREHNRICDVMAAAHPDWDDERLFQTARNVMTVILLKIVAGDYVAHISSVDFPFKVVPGMAEKESWYRTNRISIEFDMLYRWHSMVPEQLMIEGNGYTSDQYCNNPDMLVQYGVDRLVTAASRQYTGRIGMKNTPAMFFMPMPRHLPDGSVDNRSIHERTVQMGRDFKLQPYNAYRRAFSLPALKSFDELTDDAELKGRLQALYGHIDAVEWHVGIFAEKHKPLAMMGELLTRMVAYDAFTHALTNPLLSENIYGPDTFSPTGLRIIEATNTIGDVVLRNVRDPAKVEAVFKIRQ
jgi:prostaglandin-endoperoxide synthase 2